MQEDVSTWKKNQSGLCCPRKTQVGKLFYLFCFLLFCCSSKDFIVKSIFTFGHSILNIKLRWRCVPQCIATYCLWRGPFILNIYIGGGKRSRNEEHEVHKLLNGILQASHHLVKRWNRTELLLWTWTRNIWISIWLFPLFNWLQSIQSYSHVFSIFHV